MNSNSSTRTLPTPSDESSLGASGAALFWLLLGAATSLISFLALQYSVGALVVFGPWTFVSYVLAMRLQLQPAERQVLRISAVLAVVSLGLSLVGVVGSASPDYWLPPIILAILSGAAVAYSFLGLLSRPHADRQSSASVATIWAQRAALVLLGGGLVTVIGSFSTWDTCSGIPCEGPGQFFSLWERSGVSFGPGLVTAALGTLIVVLAIDASRGENHAVAPEISTIAAASALLVIGGFIVRVNLVPLYVVYGSHNGLYFVALGATAALLASLRLRRTWRSAERRGTGTT